jgi:integrase|tara:strand:+ start:702 stop:1928 length:1227 start_codon:yes stop_codon:yes gene_type:complete
MPVFPDGPGKWHVYVDVYYKGTTKRKSQRHRRFQGTKTAAIKYERELILERDAGRLIDRTNQTLGQYLESWFEEYEMTVSINTFKTAKNHLARVWKTALHEIPLSNLETEYIQEVINHMNNVDGLSYGAVANFRDNLRHALNRAVELKYIKDNPILLCKLPKETRKKKIIWTREQLDGYLGYIHANRSMYTDAFELILFTGFRRAEVCGLHWSMVNFDDHFIDMNRTRHSMPSLGPGRPGGGWYEVEPKTESSSRYIEISPKCVALLRKVQAEQAHYQVIAPGIWPADPFVICRQDGEVTRPDRLSRQFSRLLKAYNGQSETAQLPSGKDATTPHDLRRHHASYLAELGYSTSAITARLGHASTNITERIYIKNRPGAFADYVSKLDEFLDPVIESPGESPEEDFGKR